MRHRNRLSFINRQTKKPDYWKILQAVLKYGWTWYREYQAQEQVLRPFNQHLDGRFILLRNVRLPDLDQPLPPILIGPTGVYLVYVSPKKGLFRVREDIWEEMSTRTRRFRPQKPNLVRRTLAMARLLSEYLSEKAGTSLEVHPVMVFVDPGTLVDAIRPAVRVVLADSLENFALQLSRMRNELAGDEVEKIVELLAPTPRRHPTGRRGKPAQVAQAEQRVQKQVLRYRSKLDRYFNFTRQQWIILGVLAVLNVCLVVGFILAVVALSTP